MHIAGLLIFSAGVALAAAKTSTPTLTFYKDVLPVLQKNCQGCHRPGEAAPMSFLTYTQTRPWAKAIREVTITRKMPPWFADPHVGKFTNDRSLQQSEIDILAKWSETGAVAGNPNDAPPEKEFVTGWNIGAPDMTVEMTKEYDVPASGTVDYTYFIIPTGFTEDRWVQMAEARPGNRKVVHHIIAFVREPGSKWLRDAKVGEPYVPKKGSSSGAGGEFLVGYAPGTVPEAMAKGQAKLIKAGSDIVLQMHYTATGKPERDRTKVGFVFSTEAPTERVVTLAASNHQFVIPPGASEHRVDAAIELHEEATLLSLLPHMHLRGKSFEYTIVSPKGERTKLLHVPRYDFNWQLTYTLDKPLRLAKGTKIECVAHYDNSPNNPSNPNPTEEVRYGDQSWEEMMFGFFNIAFDPQIQPRDLVRPKRTSAAD